MWVQLETLQVQGVKSRSVLHLRTNSESLRNLREYLLIYFVQVQFLSSYLLDLIPFTLVPFPPDPSLSLCDRYSLFLPLLINSGTCPCSSSQTPVPVPVPPPNSEPLLYINPLYLSIQDNLIIVFNSFHCILFRLILLHIH